MSEIKFLVMDVDGTLTDGKIYIGDSGEVFKAFNAKDGCGIKDILPKKNIEPVIITARESVIVYNRFTELGVKYIYQKVKDKLKCLNEMINKYNAKNDSSFSLQNIAYIGDDLPDLPCMEAIKKDGGLCACPNDASKEIKALCNFVSCKAGGNGAVRELIDCLLSTS